MAASFIALNQYYYRWELLSCEQVRRALQNWDSRRE